jgi:hypothetical protein
LHHTDGPRYKPLVGILSLGGPTVMTFRAKLSAEELGIKDSSDLFSVVLQSNSFLVFGQEIYSEYMHGIAPDKPVDVLGECAECINMHLLPTDVAIGDMIPRGDRVSMTFRNVSL